MFGTNDPHNTISAPPPLRQQVGYACAEAYSSSNPCRAIPGLLDEKETLHGFSSRGDWLWLLLTSTLTRMFDIFTLKETDRKSGNRVHLRACGARRSHTKKRSATHHEVLFETHDIPTDCRSPHYQPARDSCRVTGTPSQWATGRHRTRIQGSGPGGRGERCGAELQPAHVLARDCQPYDAAHRVEIHHRQGAVLRLRADEQFALLRVLLAPARREK